MCGSKKGKKGSAQMGKFRRNEVEGIDPGWFNGIRDRVRRHRAGVVVASRLRC